jgi:hypothetical protein
MGAFDQRSFTAKHRYPERDLNQVRGSANSTSFYLNERDSAASTLRAYGV